MHPIDTFRANFTSGDPTQREECLEQLQALGPVIPFSDFSFLASDPEPTVRDAFLKTVAIYGRDVAQACALAAIRDTDEIVRITAAELLAEFPPDRTTLENLKDDLDDPDPIFRRSLAEVFGASGNPDFIPMLEGRLSYEISNQAKLGLLSALYRLGQRNRSGEICLILHAVDYHDRCAAANVLADLMADTHDAQVIRALKEILVCEPTVAARSSLNNALRQIANCDPKSAAAGADCE